MSGWESIHHRCPTPREPEIHRKAAGQGSVWVCQCSARWRLVINVGRFSWFCLDNEQKVWVGEV